MARVHRPSCVLASLVVVVAAAVGASIAACGRSVEPRVACPAPAGACVTMDADSATLAQAHADAVAAADPQAAAEAGQCLAVLVEERLESSCIAPCDALCALHPCNVRDGDAVLPPSSCSARCGALVADGAIADDVVRAAAVIAANDPNLCTCQPCSAGDALCPGLFDCAAP